MESYDMTTEAQAPEEGAVEGEAGVAAADPMFVDAQLAEFVSRVRDSLEWLEDGDDDTPRYIYVQSAVIAASDSEAVAVPVARIRWDADTGEYEHTPVIEEDGRR